MSSKSFRIQRSWSHKCESCRCPPACASASTSTPEPQAEPEPDYTLAGSDQWSEDGSALWARKASEARPFTTNHVENAIASCLWASAAIALSYDCYREKRYIIFQLSALSVRRSSHMSSSDGRSSRPESHGGNTRHDRDRH